LHDAVGALFGWRTVDQIRILAFGSYSRVCDPVLLAGSTYGKHEKTPQAYGEKIQINKTTVRPITRLVQLFFDAKLLYSRNYYLTAL
jgi:hypothetical protein